MNFKIAAIDIGSNACRLQITDVINALKPNYALHTVDLFRMPIRLGQDVFDASIIGIEKEQLLLKAFQAFKNIMDIHGVKYYRACATSAMRDAKNNSEIIKKIDTLTGIHLEIIDGIGEANYIIHSQDEDIIDEQKKYLFVDVGGGSTQVSLIHNSKVLYSHSFQIGTVRLLKNRVEETYWRFFKGELKQLAETNQIECIVGSGGNINRIHKLVYNKKSDNKQIDRKLIEDTYHTLNALTVEERIEKYKMNSDRADVIAPAAKIYHHALKATGLKYILVPRITLIDGLIKHLYEDIRQRKNVKQHIITTV
jgi:exopolyphosphatase/guanosine-5'-triphosphate,3'-diphosphate pyrophosphatase